MKVKICGITNTNEIDKLIETGTDYVGMVLFFEKSKRNISIEKAKELVGYAKTNSDSLKTVAVVVKPSYEQVIAIEEVGFDIIQIHGDIDMDIVSKINIPIFRAVNVLKEDDINKIKQDEVVNNEKIIGILVDAKVPGSGEMFDWSMENKIRIPGKLFILAGGLNISNVEKGISIFEPDVVDCSSGVEFDDSTIVGKDLQKVEKFVNTAKRVFI